MTREQQPVGRTTRGDRARSGHHPGARVRLAAVVALVAGGALTATTLAAPAGAAPPPRPGKPEMVQVPADVGGVKNLDVGTGGRLVWASGGEDAVRVVEATEAAGRLVVRTVATLPAGSSVAAAQSDRGHTWVVYGAGDGESASVWSVDRAGRPARVLDLATFQADESPDPYDLEGVPEETNAYDVEALRDGSALVADAAGNDLLRVWPDGRAVTVACFPNEIVSTADVPPEVLEQTGPLPPELPAEAVPTGVVVDRHGWAYVSELKGFPFALGSSNVWRVDPDGVDQGCDGDPGTPVAPGDVVAEDFSGINDVTVDSHGNLYVTELSTLGVWAVEMAFADPSAVAGTGRVTRVTPGGARSTVGSTPLTLPGSTVVTARGHVYVADTFLFGARLVRVV